MVESALIKSNESLRRSLAFLIAAHGASSTSGIPEYPAFDVIVSFKEICSHHGTGILLQRLFEDSSSLLTIRVVDKYGGQQSVGDINLRLPALRMRRTQIFDTVSGWMRAIQVRRIVCVPWSADEVLTAIAVKEITNADLCMYIMDDQNITTGLIPDDVMREALSKARLRLVISPEMRSAYQNKYRLKFWIMPPLVDHRLLGSNGLDPDGELDRGVLVGNIWSPYWLGLLRDTVRTAGVKIDWYCNAGAPWLRFDPEELKQDGINCLPHLPESKLARVLSRYPYAVIPSGTLDDNDDNRWVAQLSLPSRIPFIMAASQAPLIVVGSPETAAARFVTRFQIGTTCQYEASAFDGAVSRVKAPHNQRTMRENARCLAPVFSDSGAGEWLRKALEQGEPPDLKYEDLFDPQTGEFVPYVEPPVPEGIFHDFHKIYQAVKRLKAMGFSPDFVLDVGASTGIWSESIRPLFPTARFILVEALASRYRARNGLARSSSEFELVETAVSNRTGRMRFQVSTDLYNSSFLQLNDASELDEAVEVGVTTLDSLAAEKEITGRGLLKIDVQSAEHLVIEGGRHLIQHNVDALALELTLKRVHPEMKTFLEIVNLMAELGFRYFDDVGEWRTPATGLLEQKDVLFVREGLFKILNNLSYQGARND
jgi:FkbM family methyltransferase